MKRLFILSISYFPMCASLNAEVTMDGTLGKSGTLSGPDYQIGADLGQQHGGNLFHSFGHFNLQSHESATFSGLNTVQNIIGRVTGGNPSSIDGTLRSTIPNADLYLLNPYGILFGKNAKLDVQGGFHASTADYLRLQDGGRFEARYPNNSLLTVASVVAFGFLTDMPAPIQTQSSKLSVLPDQTLSLIGGDIHLTSDVPLMADNSQLIPPVIAESILAAAHGRVNLASLASRGEIIPSENDLILQGNGGKVTIENTLIELSGKGGGAAFIRAKQFILNNAVIRSNTFGNQDGKDINLKVTEAAFLNGVNGEISVLTTSTNKTGSILIDAPYLEMTNALIFTGAVLTGKAGPIEIQANQIFLRDGAMIGSGAAAIGRSGDLTFNVANNLSISGFYPGFRSFHGQTSENGRSMIFSVSLGTQQSGNIWVDTRELNLNFGGIFTDAYGTGPGGDITIHAQSARLIEGGIISSTTRQMAPAGDIKIRVDGQLYLAGWTPVALKALGRSWGINPSSIRSGTEEGSGKGGVVDIQASEVILTKGGAIGADSDIGTGEAGEVHIKANTLQLTDGGIISTLAPHATGGNIILTIFNLLYLRGGQITTSVTGGIGNGGNITIENPQFVVLNQGRIVAQADEGRGGNIHIVADQFVATPESLVSASSNRGISGNVVIHSPENNIAGNLLTLSKEFKSIPNFSEFCKHKVLEEKDSFKVIQHRQNRANPSDWQASPKPNH